MPSAHCACLHSSSRGRREGLLTVATASLWLGQKYLTGTEGQNMKIVICLTDSNSGHD